MAEEDLRRPKISFDGPAEPRIINATPESCLIEQLNTEPTKEELAKKAIQKKIEAIVNPAPNQSFGEIPEALTSMGRAGAVTASEEKVSFTMFTQLNRIKEEAKKIQTKKLSYMKKRRSLQATLKLLKKRLQIKNTSGNSILKR